MCSAKECKMHNSGTHCTTVVEPTSPIHNLDLCQKLHCEDSFHSMFILSQIMLILLEYELYILLRFYVKTIKRKTLYNTSYRVFFYNIHRVKSSLLSLELSFRSLLQGRQTSMWRFYTVWQFKTSVSIF